MATVTTTTIPIGKTTIWEQPSSVAGNQSGIPIAKMVFEDTITLLGKDAADVHQWNLTCVLPVNYVFRVTYMHVTTLAGTFNPYFDWGPAMPGQLIDGNGSLSRFFFENKLLLYGTGVVFGGVQFETNVAGTALRQEYIAPDQGGLLLDNSKAGGAVAIDWFDLTADDTADMTVTFRIEAMMYTIDALNAWRVNIPTLITPGVAR